MNGVQLTFFNFAGYLVPGLIFMMVVGPIYFAYPGVQATILANLSTINLDAYEIKGAALVALFFLPFLATAFLVGVVISDSALWLLTLLSIPSWTLRNRQPSSLYSVLVSEGRSEVIANRFPAREMIALSATGGWDLYGSAGRARMLTASGSAIVLSGFFYLCFSLYVFAVLISVGLYLIFLGRNLSIYYNEMCEYVAFLQENKPAADLPPDQ